MYYQCTFFFFFFWATRMKTNVNFSFAFVIYLSTFLWITVCRSFPLCFSWMTWICLRSRNYGKRMRSCHWGIKLMDCRYPVYIVCYTTWTCRNWIKSNSLFFIYYTSIAAKYLLKNITLLSADVIKWIVQAIYYINAN